MAEAETGGVVMGRDSKIGGVRNAEKSNSERIESERVDVKINVKKFDLPKEVTRVGLCASCQHVQRVKSDRGSAFYRCGKAASDPRFAKYPRLPMLQCAGHEAVVSSR